MKWEKFNRQPIETYMREFRYGWVRSKEEVLEILRRNRPHNESGYNKEFKSIEDTIKEIEKL